jgi:hypothetical protein
LLVSLMKTTLVTIRRFRMVTSSTEMLHWLDALSFWTLDGSQAGVKSPPQALVACGYFYELLDDGCRITTKSSACR